MNTIKTIEKAFTKEGFCHRQIKRVGNVALYERWFKDANKFGNNPILHWEVVIIQDHKDFKIQGRTIEAAEYYPNSNEWGTNGFTFNCEDQARAKFNSLT